MDTETTAPSGQVLGNVGLSPRMSAVRLARWTVRSRCAGSGLPCEVIDNASLLAGEMAATALHLRRRDARLVVSVEAGLLVQVRTDGDARPGADREHAASTARCMALVSRSARSWGLDCAESRYDFCALLTGT